MVGFLAIAMVVGACGSSSKKASRATTTPGAATTAPTGSASGNPASAPGVTATTVKIGFITDVTGSASSTWSNSALGAKARFTALNSQGGVGGRKIDSSPRMGPRSRRERHRHELPHRSRCLRGDRRQLLRLRRRAPNAQKAGLPVTGPGIEGTE